MISSSWSYERFGELAPQMRDLVVAAMSEAHRYAVSAQVTGGSSMQDTYGHTMKNRQHECLRASAHSIEGVDEIPVKGAHHPLIRISSTGTVLFPWRWGRDNRIRRQDARMKPSDIRLNLLGAANQHDQLVLPGQHMTYEDVCELYEEQEQQARVLAELQRSARVVVVGYASTSEGLRELGWGEIALHEDGKVDWLHHESLPSTIAANNQSDGELHRRSFHPLSSAVPASAARTAEPRFDDGQLDDFDLAPRRPMPKLAPEQEPQAPSPQTGTAEEGQS